MKAEEIKAAVDAGKKVHWSNKSYHVIKGKDDYMIKGPTGHAIGLTWEDGKTLNGKEEDFFLAEAIDLTTVPQKVADAIEDVFNSMKVRTKKVEVIRNDEPESFDVAVIYGDGKDDEFSFHVDPSDNLILSDFTFSKNMGKAGDSQSNIAKKIKDHFSSLKENNKPTYMKHVKLFEEFVGESKKFSDAFAVLDFFAGALPNDYNKAHAAAKKAGYDLPTSLYDEAAMMAQDGENENLQRDFEQFINEAKQYDAVILEPGKGRAHYKKIATDLTKQGIKAGTSAGKDNIILVGRLKGKEAADLLKDQGIEVVRFSGDGGEWTPDLGESVSEGRIALNHVYANAPVRNKVLEILRNGRVTEQDFMNAVSKAGAPSKWISRNSHFFKVEEEDGVKYYSLSKTGHVIMSAINESEVLDIYEEFGLEENLVVDPLDLTKDFFYVSINGTVYGYQAKSGGNVEDLAKTFKGMLKYSAGKALAWLKKNAELVSGSKKALNEAKDVLTTKDKEWVKSLGSNNVVYSDQGGSGDHTLSAILSLMAGGTLKRGGAANFGFDHVDMYDESGKTVLPSATAGKYTFDQLLDKAKTIVKRAGGLKKDKPLKTWGDVDRYMKSLGYTE